MNKITLDNEFLRNAVDMTICELRPLMRAYGSLSHENDYNGVKKRIIAEIITRIATDIAEHLAIEYFVTPYVDEDSDEKPIQYELDHSFDAGTLLN